MCIHSRSVPGAGAEELEEVKEMEQTRADTEYAYVYLSVR